ncbi:MAG: outer membrane protein assembly factor BamD [Thermoguttaceae bacterium]
MSSKTTRGWLSLALAVGVLGGCAGFPPAPSNAQNGDNRSNYEYDGWLFKSVTGRRSCASTSGSATSGTASVAMAAATTGSATVLPAVGSEAPGPLVAGPSSAGPRGKPVDDSGPWVIPVSAETPIVGPPPTIPDELPAPSKDSVRIDEAKRKDEESKKGFDLSDLAPDKVYKNVKNATGYGPNEKIAREAMQEGKRLFAEKKYKEAAAQFAKAAERWPDSPLEEDATFSKGESEFFADLYPKAHDTYGGLLKKYSNTRHLDTVSIREFTIGRYWEQLQDTKPMWTIAPNMTDSGRPLFDTFGYAVQAFERVHQNDPTGPLADDALMALGNAYFRRGQYENAAYNYDLLRKEYPNSEFQMKAHVLGLQSKMRMYQGAMYVGGPLKDADKLAKNTLTQYGNKLGPERDRVARAESQIVEEKANRMYAVAQYYDQNKYYGAAKIYYKNVIDDFPGTDRAKQSQARMDQIRNEPDSPPDHFKWLNDALKSNK